MSTSSFTRTITIKDSTALDRLKEIHKEDFVIKYRPRNTPKKVLDTILNTYK